MNPMLALDVPAATNACCAGNALNMNFFLCLRGHTSSLAFPDSYHKRLTSSYCEPDGSPLPCVKYKNAWSCISTHLFCSNMGMIFPEVA